MGIGTFGAAPSAAYAPAPATRYDISLRATRYYLQGVAVSDTKKGLLVQARPFPL